MNRTALAFILLVCANTVFAQAPLSYSDVGVIINTNDSTSKIIGEYFVAQRNVPQKNIIYIDAPAQETITFEQFSAVRTQIETYLQQNNLTDQLNYLVTTKGVPLRVNLSDVGTTSSKSASFDSELMLILGPMANYIGDATLLSQTGGLMVHPYWRKNARYSRATYGMYLVTRLTALTRERVIELIDRQGPYTYVNKDSAVFILDQDPLRSGSGYAQYNTNMVTAASELQTRGWNVLLNTDSVYIINQQNVLGYVSWGSNDHFASQYTTKARPGNSWLKGSIAETYVSTGARNFQPGQESGQSRIADLFEEGCAASSGYVFEPFTLALAWVDILFPRYVDGHYLADAYYMSLPTFSWMAIVVGDPKTTITTELPPPAPVPTLPASTHVCQNDDTPIVAENLQLGNYIWFNADIATVQTAGPPYDSTHPNFLSSDSVYTPDTGTLGTFTLSFMNENYVGKGFAETEVTVVPGLEPGFTVSADSVFLDESGTITCTDNTTNATTWNWDFGDNVGTSTEQSPQYTYTTAGKYTITLEVSNSGCSETLTKNVTVTETQSKVAFSDYAVDFGKVFLTQSSDKEITIQNIRPQSLTVNAIAVSGTNGTEFTIENAHLPMLLGINGEKSFVVKFAPGALGERTAVVSVSHTDTDTPVQITLRGEGVDESSAVSVVHIPGEATLYQNYPNPFNPSTTISYNLERAQYVTLTVYDAMGRTIETLVQSEQAPGMHSIQWNASAYPSGTYMYRLTVNGKVLTRSMSLMK